MRGLILSQGYERIGDTAAIKKLGNQNPLYTSTINLTSFTKARSEWSRSNLPPPPNAAAEIRASYFRKQLEFFDQWMDRLPENPNLLSERFKALASIPETPNDQLIHEGDRILATIRNSRSHIPPRLPSGATNPEIHGHPFLNRHTFVWKRGHPWFSKS